MINNSKRWTVLIVSYGDKGFPNFDALVRSNPGADIRPVIDDYPGDDQTKWRNADRFIRKWWTQNRSSVTTDRVAVLEWDTLVTCPLPDIHPEGIVGGSVRGNDGWCWWPESERLTGIEEFAVGISPLAVLYASANAMDALSNPRWDDLYSKDIFGELRLASVIYASGFPVEKIDLPNVTNRIGPDPTWDGSVGIFHPITTNQLVTLKDCGVEEGPTVFYHTRPYDDNAIAPIGEADATLLAAICSYYNRPKVLEFGSLFGHSASVWLEAGAEKIVGVDYAYREEMARVAKKNKRVIFSHCRQEHYQPSEFFDIIFIDASHEFELNLITLENVEPWLSDGGSLIVHDTGVWAACAMTDRHWGWTGDSAREIKGYAHCPGERQFAKELKSRGWHCVDFGSKTALRHGMTVCQKP